MFDEAAAEPLAGRRNDTGSAALPPAQIEPPGLHGPAEFHAAFGARERSILRRVGREFMQRQRERQRLTWRNVHGRTNQRDLTGHEWRHGAFSVVRATSVSAAPRRV